jgi:fatty acid synthase subunit beta, fungi type
MFWKEMDDTIFSLPKEKLLAVLKQKKSYIIKRLNTDFQKPWFGKNSKGEVVDLEDMTYAEVLNRMVEIMFVAHEKRWIDVTLRNLTGDFIRRLEERFTHEEGRKSVLQSYSELESPYPVVEKLLEKYPEASQQLMNSQDVEHFLFLCGRFIQKPVPFIPVLDKDFQGWFKRDSLWQSEDLEAVVGQDVGRVCILQGPMAAKHSKKVNQPIKEIFDDIHEGHIASLKKRYYDDDESKIPLVEYFGGAPIEEDATQTVEGLEGVRVVSDSPEKVVYQLASQASGAVLPDEEKWIQHLAGPGYSWKRALFTSDVVIQGKQFLKNSIRSLFAPRFSQQVEIDLPDTPDKTIVTVFSNRSGELVPAVQASRIDANTVQVALFENRSAEGNLVKLPLLFKYLPATGFAPIQEVMEGRNDRIKKFYWQLWFGSEPMPEDSKVTDVFKSEKTTVDAAAIAEFCHSVGNRSEAYIEKPSSQPLAPMDFAIVVGWKSIIQAIFPKSIDGDLLKLVHLSNGFKMTPGARPLKTGDVVSTSAQVTAVINNDSGKMVEVQGEIFRDNKPVMEVKSQFLYRGDFKDFENTFRKSNEIPVQLKLSTAKDVAVLRAKEWFHPINDRLELLNASLTFRLSSTVRFKNKTIFSSVETTGSVWMEMPTKEIIQVASVEYECGESHGNPVVDYLKRHGTPIEQPVQFDNGGYSVMPDPSILTGDIVSPPHNSPYASVSSDFNPIHVNPYFATYASLPGTITHGMWTSAATRKFVETFAAENHPERVTMFDVKFMDMVLPGTRLETKLAHTGMMNGKKIIKVETFNLETGSKVIEGTAEIDQPVTAYVFTGQGSQEQGMGMDLYESSPVARAIWDKADEHFLHHYGFSIVDIVRNNPKELTVYFGGPKGKAIRQNYLNMVYEQVDANGVSKVVPIFKGIDENSTFYKFVSPTGLLSATQFTQPALTLMEKAAFEDMKAKGLVQRDCAFAGHSLGEYSALAAIGDVLPIESLVDIVFYRGLTMQVAVVCLLYKFSLMCLVPRRSGTL